MNGEVHTFVIDDQQHHQMIEINAKLARLCMMHGMCHILNLCYMMWKRGKNVSFVSP
jgi:aspartate 1-decarboxylase